MICKRASIWRTDKNHTVRIDNVQFYICYAFLRHSWKGQEITKCSVSMRCMEPAVLRCCMASGLGALFTKAGQQARLMLFAANKVSLKGLKTPK